MSHRREVVAYTCPHCKGTMEHVGNDRVGRAIIRCTACGRDLGTPSEIVKENAKETAKETVKENAKAPAHPRPCTVKGCPGILDAQGACACCAKRQAYLEAHLPKRQCNVCEGELTGRNIKFCNACKPVVQRIAMRTSKSSAAA